MADLFTLRIFSRNLLRGIAEEIYIFFHISFWCLNWDTNTDFTSNKPRYYLLHTSFTSTSWRAATKKSVIMVRELSSLTVMVAPPSISKKYEPMIPPFHTRNGLHWLLWDHMWVFRALNKAILRIHISTKMKIIFIQNWPNKFQRCLSVNRFTTFSGDNILNFVLEDGRFETDRWSTL